MSLVSHKYFGEVMFTEPNQEIPIYWLPLHISSKMKCAKTSYLGSAFCDSRCKEL